MATVLSHGPLLLAFASFDASLSMLVCPQHAHTQRGVGVVVAEQAPHASSGPQFNTQCGVWSRPLDGASLLPLIEDTVSTRAKPMGWVWGMVYGNHNATGVCGAWLDEQRALQHPPPASYDPQLASDFWQDDVSQSATDTVNQVGAACVCCVCCVRV